MAERERRSRNIERRTNDAICLNRARLNTSTQRRFDWTRVYFIFLMFLLCILLFSFCFSYSVIRRIYLCGIWKTVHCRCCCIHTAAVMHIGVMHSARRKEKNRKHFQCGRNTANKYNWMNREWRKTKTKSFTESRAWCLTHRVISVVAADNVIAHKFNHDISLRFFSLALRHTLLFIMHLLHWMVFPHFFLSRLAVGAGEKNTFNIKTVNCRRVLIQLWIWNAISASHKFRTHEWNSEMKCTADIQLG